MDFIDYYAELGVPRTATQEEIQKAYKKLARTTHPDVNKAPDAEDRFKRLGEAYEVLGDAEKRSRYDRFGSAWKHGRPSGRTQPGFDFDFGSGGGRSGQGAYTYSGNGSFSDFFETFFGKGGNTGDVFTGAGGRARQRRAGRSHGGTEARLKLSLEDAARGGQREITLNDPASGTSRKYVVNVPVGVRSGQKIRLRGKRGADDGDKKNGPAGDVILIVDLEPHPRFRLDGKDLHTSLPVSPWVAALGGPAKLATLDGIVTVAVPPGSSTGRKIRLKGKGFPNEKDGTGDLYAEIKVMVPKTLSAEERELFERLASESKFSPDTDV